MWCGMGSMWLLLVASPALNGAVWLSEPLPPSLPPNHPPTPLLRWTEISMHQKKIVSAIHKVNYTKSNGLLCLLLLIHDGQLQAASCFN